MAMDGPLGLSFTVTKAYISLLVVVLLLDTRCCVVELCLEFPDPLGLIWENVKEHSQQEGSLYTLSPLPDKRGLCFCFLQFRVTGHWGPSPEHLVVSRAARAGQKESSVREESHDQPNSKKAAPAEVLKRAGERRPHWGRQHPEQWGRSLAGPGRHCLSERLPQIIAFPAQCEVQHYGCSHSWVSARPGHFFPAHHSVIPYTLAPVHPGSLMMLLTQSKVSVSLHLKRWNSCWVWWHMSLTPALERQRQAFQEFKAFLVYI